MADRAKRLFRLAAVTAAALFGSVLVLRLAIQFVPGAGPWLADSLRSILGTEAVTWLEETSARLEDRARRQLGSSAPPRTLEQAEPLPLQPDHQLPASKPSPPQVDRQSGFVPADVGPMDRRVAGPGDGHFRPVADPARPDAEPLLFATLLHPDRQRRWAEVFVVAVPIAAVRLYAVAGTVEPQATTQAGRDYERRGLVPVDRRSALLAAFNGGFMTKHGQHGMHVDGVTLVPAKPHLCTILALEDGRLEVGSWRHLAELAEGAERDSNLVFWRQAAPCMYEGGQLNPALRDENVRNWGATIDGDVVIRRSALGLDSSRATLFVGISNDTTARAIAEAMHHAGASDVAQLDVNWSYPKFLLFPRDSDGRRRALGLFEGFVFRPDEYVTRPSTRDFFYLVRRTQP